MDFGDLRAPSYLAEIRLQEGRIKSTEATSSGVGVRIRSADDSTDADIIARRVVGQSLAIGEVDIHIRPSSLPPTNPSLGDLWFEVGAQSELIYGWPWSWNGSYWLSPQQNQRISFDNLSALTRIHFVGSHSQNLDYFFEQLIYSVVVPTANNASNRWSLQFQRLPSSGSSTAIGNAITTDQIGGVDVYGNLVADLNIHVDMSALNPRVFRSVLTRVGSPGNLFGCAELFFRYARP